MFSDFFAQIFLKEAFLREMKLLEVIKYICTALMFTLGTKGITAMQRLLVVIDTAACATYLLFKITVIGFKRIYNTKTADVN